MRVLVTGGSGFIGASLVPALQARGHEVIVYDLCPPEGADTPRVIGDIRSAPTVCSAMKTVDVVVHLAAMSGIGNCEYLPYHAAATNIGLEVMIEAARAGVKRFAYASSMAAADGTSWYGATKLAQEALAHSLTMQGKLDCTGLRFANVYGPNSWDKTSVVATWMRAALRGEPLEIHGDGSDLRDFVHVDDVCAAIVRAVEGAALAPVSNVCTSRQTSIGELAAIVSAITGAKAEKAGVVFMPGNEARRAIAAPDTDRQRSLEGGLVRTWQWFREEWQRRKTPQEAAA